MKELEWSCRETVPLICIYVYIYCCLQKCRIENHLKDSAFIPLIIRNPNNYTPKKRRIGHFVLCLNGSNCVVNLLLIHLSVSKWLCTFASQSEA